MFHVKHICLPLSVHVCSNQKIFFLLFFFFLLYILQWFHFKHILYFLSYFFRFLFLSFLDSFFESFFHSNYGLFVLSFQCFLYFCIYCGQHSLMPCTTPSDCINLQALYGIARSVYEGFRFPDQPASGDFFDQGLP